MFQMCLCCYVLIWQTLIWADGHDSCSSSIRAVQNFLTSTPVSLSVFFLFFLNCIKGKDHKETQTAVVWSCFPFIRSGQNHLARHSERGKKTRQTEEEMGRHHQGMDQPGVRQVSEGSGEQGKNGENWLQNHLRCPNDPRG